jgi:RNA polymerase sigma-70 factor (ECF subfamily)
VLGTERRRLLLDAVERLPEEQRLVVTCRFFLDLSEAETAAVLGVRKGTAKSRLSRALARLRAEVPEDA